MTIRTTVVAVLVMSAAVVANAQPTGGICLRDKPADTATCLHNAPRRTGRTIGEIQLAYERIRADYRSVYQLYQQSDAGRAEPEGTITLRLTIDADGNVSETDIASSTFQNTALNAPILALTRAMRFAPIDGAPFTYPNFSIVLKPD